MRKLILILTLLLSSNAYATGWYCLGLDTTKDCAFFYADTALLIVDAAQTHDIKRHEGLEEKNKFLGKQPSKSKINTYFLGWIVASYAVNKWAPEIVKDIYNAGLITVEVGAIANNVKLGIDVKF